MPPTSTNGGQIVHVIWNIVVRSCCLWAFCNSFAYWSLFPSVVVSDQGFCCSVIFDIVVYYERFVWCGCFSNVGESTDIGRLRHVKMPSQGCAPTMWGVIILWLQTAGAEKKLLVLASNIGQQSLAVWGCCNVLCWAQLTNKNGNERSMMKKEIVYAIITS